MSVVRKYRQFLLQLIDLAIWMAGAVLGMCVAANVTLIRIQVFAVIAAVHIIVYQFFFMYQVIWRYAGFRQIVKCIVCEAISYLLLDVAATIFFQWRIERFCAAGFLCSALLMVTSRLGYMQLISVLRGGIQPAGETGVRTLIIGAGDAARILLVDMKRDAEHAYAPVGLLDDDQTKIGRRILNVKVLGPIDRLKEYAEQLNVELIVFAIFAISEERKRAVMELCTTTGKKVLMAPSPRELKEVGEGVSRRLRDVDIHDLLGREPVLLDESEVESFIRGRCVLVTGGGGSIGSELCRQIAAMSPARIVLLDVYENGVYEVQQELRRKYGDRLSLFVEILSVCDFRQLERVFETHRPELVFHAAAHKHVPLMEDAPEEAIQNNIFGTLNTVRLADQYGVKRFVLISTDKAVNPTNVMGATKRCCELMIQAMGQKSRTEFMAVRFGNVLGSNGSVIPLFRRQIAEGGPVTVTHPDIIRYFMTIPEAVRLVLTAAGMAKGGEIFILDMGKPVRILDMAKNMIRLSGLEPEKDIPIVFTGLRPGEKLYEELLLSEEGTDRTEHEKIFVAKPAIPEQEVFWAQLKRLKQAVQWGNRAAALELLRKLVPTYRPEQTEPRSPERGGETIPAQRQEEPLCTKLPRLI